MFKTILIIYNYLAQCPPL